MIALLECDLDDKSVINGSTAEELRAILAFQRGVLTAEIRTLRPTALLFFTGPYYDVAIRDEFPDVIMQPELNRTEREFARLIHPDFPSATFRTYHPKYLRCGRKWNWLEPLAESRSRSPVIR